MTEIQSDITTIRNFKIYKLMFECYRCHGNVPVASYYFYHEHFQAIGDVGKLDRKLEKKYPFIKKNFDESLGREVIANHCPHCGLMIANSTIAWKIVKMVTPENLHNFEDTSFKNNLRLEDLKTNAYEKYGLDSQHAKALTDIEKLIGYTFVPKKHITIFLTGIIIDNNQLTGLSLSSINLESLPQSVCQLTDLKKLILSFNYIKSLPECFQKLENLEELDLSRNRLFPFPEVITKIKSLKKLKLDLNSYKIIPESIGYLINLEELSIHQFNNITPLPESLWNISSLKILKIKTSRIGKIPESIGNLKSLEHLTLKSNDLNALPESISKLKALKQFEFNPKKNMEIPRSIQELINRLQKPKKLVTLRKVYSKDVKVSFTKMRMVLKLQIKDDTKVQREDIHKWEWEDSEWERLDEDIVFPYDEIYVIPSVEVNNYVGIGYLNRPLPRKLHLKRKGGIRVKDLKEAYNNHLPDYGDFHFFESLEYLYDYDGIPTFYLFIGS